MSKASLELGGGNWGTKDGNLLAYAQGNESSNLVPREFTFTRGSDIAATRINSSGLIEKYRENLLLQSNQFDTSWTLNSTSVTSGQSGYDGTNDAWLLNSTTTGFPRIEQLVSASGVNTYSVYLKPATDGFINMRIFGADAAVWFNANDGLIANASGSQYVSSNIQSVGNGWYRCSVVVNGSITSVRIYPASSYGTYSTNGNGVYIQDAQLERGLVATSYLESGATTATSGVADNEPRIDYAGGTASLLLEPSRTNLVEYSEYKASGDFTNSTPSYNAASSPEGLQNATEMFDDSTNGQHRVPIGSFAVTSGTDYTISAFVKNNDIGYCYLLLEGGFTQTRYYFNLSTGEPITSGLEVENFADGWYRIYVTQSAASSGTGSVYLNMSNNGVSPIYVGSSQSLYFYGLQVEQGSYPTSYIPNHSGGSVTRNADYSESSTSLSIGDSEFCAYYEMDAEAIPRESFDTFFRIEFGSSSDFIGIKGFSSTTNNIYTLQTIGNYSETMGNVTQAGVVKFLINYSSGTGDLYVNGTKYAAVISGTATGNTINNIELRGSGYAHDSKQILIFPTALSDDECIALTTL